MEEVTITKNKPLIDDMFKAGAHFGYSKSKRHPSMARYIFGVKNRVEIFDLEKTEKAFEDAKEPEVVQAPLEQRFRSNPLETLAEAVDRKNRFKKEEVNPNPYWNEKCRRACEEADEYIKKLQN